MKNSIYILIIALVFTSCKRNDDMDDDNPNLFRPIVNFNINLNLNTYIPLESIDGSSVVFPQLGVQGIVVYNVNSDLYTAFDLADPNHLPNNCSMMELDGIFATCPCGTDNNSYEIVSGQHLTEPNTYTMQRYNAVRTGNTIRISN